MSLSTRDARVRVSAVLLGAGVSLVVAVVVLELTRTGVDVVALAGIGALVVLLERTAGDWLADRLGPAAGSLVFGATVGCLAWYLMGTSTGRAAVDDFLAGAEARGYRSLILRVSPSAMPAGLAPAVPAAPVAGPPAAAPTSGSSLPSGARAQPTAPRLPVRAASRMPSSGRSESVAGGSAEAVISPVPTRVTLQVSPSTVRYGERFTLRATVTARGNGPGVGTVDFLIEDRVLATASVPATGTVIANVTILESGTHSVRARFTGAAGYSGSVSDTVTVTIAEAVRSSRDSLFPRQ
jgi:hypothetical protein